MHILMVCHEYPPIGGGAAAVCDALARHYQLAGQRVTVVTMGYADLPAEEVAGGVQVRRIACGRRRKEMASPREGLVWAYRSWPLVRQMHRETPFDATHAHFIMPGGIIATWLKRRCGVPFVVTPHGSDVPGYNRERLQLAHRLARPWWKRICRRADRLISPSASLLKQVEGATTDFRGEVIPNGFQPGRFRPLKKEKRILLCSRLVERKGFQYFLEAIRDLELPGWQVDLVGDGPMFGRLAEAAARCRIPVTMHGWIDNDDPRLAKLYGQAMVFAFPSEWENFSIALLEGMSAGCAVMTTDVSGNPEVVGDTGRLVEPRDVAAIRQCVLEWTADPGRCEQLGQRAAERAVSQFSWTRLTQQYLNRLEQVRQRPA